MELYEIIILSVFILAWSVSQPYLKRFKIYRFSSLLILTFITGILMSWSLQTKGWEYRSMALYFLLIGGIFYQAYKFYRENLSDNQT